ncbi:MAG: biopolymer transporter ExbD [Bacteroidales bacterium]|nr:biopolymer transporter ExbD [Bacteroidales bacterium]
MRQVGDINASSQADIAFLLLIFFLVTTSMDVDQGLLRQLPPPSTDQPEAQQINERNIFIVLINKDNQLAIEGDYADFNELTDRTIKFLTNPTNADNLSEQVKASAKYDELAGNPDKKSEAEAVKAVLDNCGDVNITRGVVSLQNDRGTKYETYIQVQNSIVAAFNICRDNFAKEYFGKVYDEITPEEQKIVKTVFPLNISEAEPRSVK